MDYKILSTVKTPQDIKSLTKSELSLLCDEIRDCLIETVSNNGGHLASNLGTVELTVALHRIFDSPADAILFDVGHQSYTHKLLTGRFEKFSTIRTEGGLSGFMNPKESKHDYYVSGHSSNCISAAYGIYKAKALKGENGTAVAIVGDGAMTGGMVYEALNNIGADNSKFIVVLNDNKMSISKNVGAIARHLNKIRLKSGYHNFKFEFSKFLNSIPIIGDNLYRFFYRIKKMFKNLIYHSNIFEGLGFNYLGPVDGHDISSLENVFNIAKRQTKPVLIHVVTVKGKGYSFAESDPGTYHGVSNFNSNEGFITNADKITYSDVFGRTLCQIAEKDDSVCAITAAMSAGTGLVNFEKKFKDRFFDVGIAEEHAVTFSAGLAKGGMKPYFAVYSSFLQRGFDQLVHDVAISELPVRFCIDRAGFVGEDGCTHQGLFDVSFLTSVPNMTVYSPTSFDELEKILLNSLSFNSPLAIRYPRGTEKCNSFEYTGNDFDVYKNDSKTAVITYGRTAFNALDAVNTEKNADFIKINKIYPICEDLCNALLGYDKILFFEESIKSGSIGEKLLCKLNFKGFKGNFVHIAVDNQFVDCASTSAQLRKYNLDTESIIEKLRGN